MSAVLVAHALLLYVLTRYTRVEPELTSQPRMELDVELSDPSPPAPPPVAQVSSAGQAGDNRDRLAPIVRREPDRPQASLSEVAPLSPLRLADQARVAANDEALAKQTEKPAFAGRSIDGMLPDGGPSKLPGFQPQTQNDRLEAAGRFLSMLQRGLPTAAHDYDAPLDLLSEGWERAHHASDLDACMRQHARFEEDLQRKLCGDVR